MGKRLLSSKEVMRKLIKLLKARLIEVDDIAYSSDLFVQGEFGAYKACMKMAKAWDGAKEILGEFEDDPYDITQQKNGLKIIPNCTIKPKLGKEGKKERDEIEKRKKAIIQNVDAEHALAQMVSEIEYRLSKLNNEYQDAYVVGLKMAYVETLLTIQKWNKREQYGLNYRVEERYPINAPEKDNIPIRKVPNWPF